MSAQCSILPPAKPRPELFYDQYIESHASRSPVHVRRNAGGEFEHRGLDFVDLPGMQIEHHAEKHACKSVPDFMHDPARFRAVLVRYMERRAMLHRPSPGTDAERLARAEAAIEALRPALELRLTRLCIEFVEAKRRGNRKRTRQLARQVASLDSQLMQSRCLAGLIIKIATLSWLQGWESVDVAEAVQMQPCAIRRILHRLRQCGDAVPGEMRRSSRGPNE